MDAQQYYEYWRDRGWVIRDALGNPLPGSENFKVEFERFARQAVENSWNMNTSPIIPRNPLPDDS